MKEFLVEQILQFSNSVKYQTNPLHYISNPGHQALNRITCVSIKTLT